MSNVIEAITASRANINNNKKNKKKVTTASIIGGLAGIGAGVGVVYALAKTKNPSLALKNLTYDEKDVLMVGLGAVTGGLTGGILSDKNKENHKYKLREAAQQYIGSIFVPVSMLAVVNKILDKTNIKMPQIPSSNGGFKVLNRIINMLPRVAATVITLVSGMEIGNKIVNKANNKIFKEEIKHDVKPEDYLVHADDLCLTASMLLKDVPSISSVTSKILPLTFIIAGSKVGMQQKEN